MPANKYADPTLNTAYARLLAAVSEAEPPAFTIYPSADQFECARKHSEDLAAAFDQYMAALIADADRNTSVPFAKRRHTIFSDALHDSDVPADLTRAAEDLRETEDA